MNSSTRVLVSAVVFFCAAAAGTAQTYVKGEVQSDTGLLIERYQAELYDFQQHHGVERTEVSPVDVDKRTTTSQSTGDTGYPSRQGGYRADDATTSGILPSGACPLSQIGNTGASPGPPR